MQRLDWFQLAISMHYVDQRAHHPLDAVLELRDVRIARTYLYPWDSPRGFHARYVN